jgi:hypothetical protein
MPGIVSTGASLSSIKSVFSGGNAFSGYNRGGSYVPNDGAMTGISTTASGLTMSTFNGKSIPYVGLSAHGVTNLTGGSPGSVTFGVSTDGRAYEYADSNPASFYENVFSLIGVGGTLDSTNVSYYEIFATRSVALGTWSSSVSPLDTWVTLGSVAAGWTLSAVANRNFNIDLYVTIRRISTGVTAASATITYQLDTTS